MTDEQCGAETTTDEPCQNRAGENGRCWIPSHNPEGSDENPQGRGFAIDEDDHSDILEAARKGKSQAGCARAAGTTRESLQRYLDAHPEFRGAFKRARARGEDELLEGGLYNPDVDSSMAKFLLASSFGYTKTEERKHTGDASGIVIDLGDDNE